eukprot:403336129
MKSKKLTKVNFRKLTSRSILHKQLSLTMKSSITASFSPNSSQVSSFSESFSNQKNVEQEELQSQSSGNLYHLKNLGDKLKVFRLNQSQQFTKIQRPIKSSSQEFEQLLDQVLEENESKMSQATLTINKDSFKKLRSIENSQIFQKGVQEQDIQQQKLQQIQFLQ